MAFELEGFDWNKIDRLACEKAIVHPLKGKYHYTPAIIHLVVFVGIIGISVLFQLIFVLNVTQTIGVYLAGVVLYSVFGMRWIAKRNLRILYEKMANGRYREGPIEIKFDETGLSYKTKYSSSFYQWECIIEVLDIPDMLIVRLSETEYFPMPENTLPGSMTKEQAKKELEAYISASL